LIRSGRAILDPLQVARRVDTKRAKAPIGDIDLIDAARRLRKSPIRGQRLVENLEQQRPVHAVVGDEHNDFIDVARENKPQGIRGARYDVLERLSVWEAYQVWCGKPARKKGWIEGLHLLVASTLPRAVVHVGELVEDARFEPTGLRYCGTGADAAL